MQAKDLMTAEVVTAGPDTPVREIARLLNGHKISAIPIAGASGEPIGMVSEGDLIGRDEMDRDRRRDWWLTLLAEGESFNAEFLASLRANERKAREIMSVPVITVGEKTEAREIAKLLAAHRIKRVPVVHDGKIVGIVSRADLVRALVSGDLMQSTLAEALRRPNVFTSFFDGIDHRFAELFSGPSAAAPEASTPKSSPLEAKLDATEFRSLVESFECRQAREKDAEHDAAAERRRDLVKQFMDEHIASARWHVIIHDAREAAARGEKEFLLLRFPSALCSDGGRAINALNQDENWAETLRGEAAEFYLRWEHELKPQGFHLAAQVLDFPGGFPGDIGLFLVWGE